MQQSSITTPDVETEALQSLISGGSRTEAAERLGVSRTTFSRWIGPGGRLETKLQQVAAREVLASATNKLWLVKP